MELKLIVIVAHLMDICPVFMDNINQLLVIESGTAVIKKDSTLETIWKSYTFSIDRNAWLSQSLGSVFMQQGCHLCTAVRDNTLYTVLESNLTDAAYLYRLPRANDGTLSTDKIAAPVKINIGDIFDSRVKIPPGGDWSNPYLRLSTNRWMFNYNICIVGENKAVITANTFKRHDGFHVMAVEFDR